MLPPSSCPPFQYGSLFSQFGLVLMVQQEMFIMYSFLQLIQGRLYTIMEGMQSSYFCYSTKVIIYTAICAYWTIRSQIYWDSFADEWKSTIGHKASCYPRYYEWNRNESGIISPVLLSMLESSQLISRKIMISRVHSIQDLRPRCKCSRKNDLEKNPNT